MALNILFRSIKGNRFVYYTRYLRYFTTTSSCTCLHKNIDNVIKLDNKFISNHRFIHRSLSILNDFRTVSVPQLAESISEGDIRWEKAAGDSVKEDEVIGEIETDKTSVPINSPCSGVIEELFCADGDTVKPGQEICKINVGEVTSATTTATPPPPPPSPSESSTDSESSVVPEKSLGAVEKETEPAPAAPAMPSQPPPTPAGPLQFSTPLTSMKTTPTPSQSQQPMPTVGDVHGGGGRGEQRVKMNRMRQRIAQRLKDAQNTYAMLTTFNEIDMSNLIEFRSTHKETVAKKHGIKFGFMSAFVKASAYALKDQPVVNAVIDENEIIYRDYIDISVAVATPKGLVVPVIRSVENMNYTDIERCIAELGEKARTNALAIEDMDGGTFTISNGGVFGSMFGTPIINPPQSSILGMHAIIERPVAINRKVEIRPMMYVALTYDHRLIDGREAVTFLRKIKAAVEDPRIMFLDI